MASNILVLLWLLGEIRYYIYHVDTKTPKYYVELIRELLYMLQRVILLKTFWTCHAYFRDTLNFLQKIGDSHVNSNKLVKQPFLRITFKYKAYLIMVLYTAVLFVQIYHGNGLGRGVNPMSTFLDVWHRLLKFAKYNLFLEDFDYFNNGTQFSNNLEVIIGISGLIAYIPRYLYEKNITKI